MPLTEFIFSTHRKSDHVWHGAFSICMVDGPIIAFMKSVVDQLPVNKRLIIPFADGFMDVRNYMHCIKDVEDLNKASTPDDIVGVLCSRNVSDPRLVYMPLDDESFEKGVLSIVSPVPWEKKKPIAYWRGGPTGKAFPSIRTSLVLKTINPNIDAKLTRGNDYFLTRAYPGRLIDLYDEDTYWSERVPAQAYADYKYLFIVDGNCIASAHQWTFGSGSVPIMITHPNNEFWFKKYLKPMETYVPIDYTLCDLEEKIQWLIDNDDKAKQIAENAVHFAKTILSAEFQKIHLKAEIERAAGI
jgi:hypothetical protein